MVHECYPLNDSPLARSRQSTVNGNTSENIPKKVSNPSWLVLASRATGRVRQEGGAGGVCTHLEAVCFAML